jgi:predicted ATPase with chaperone activity
LKTAVERLGLGLADVYAVNEIAKSIAILDGASLIEVYHVAEAIQYVGLGKDKDLTLIKF